MTQILPRRGTAAQWTTANPVLGVGELGYETDTKRWKRGDGATAWTALAYTANTVGMSILGAVSVASARSAMNVPSVGEAAAVFTADGSTTVAQINTWLASPLANGGPHRLQGSLTINAPIIIPSDTTLIATGATITLAPGSNTNMMRNANSVAPQRSVTDAAATSGSASVTSATANFTSADVGRSLVIADAGGNGNGPLVGVIQSVTNSTTVVLSEKATATVTGKSGKVYVRDTNITVIGGIWNRGANAGSLTGLHSLLFRHVDYLTVDIESYLSTGGKYGIAPGDVRHFRLACRDGDTSSSPIQVNGPAFDGHIEYVGGTSHDDHLAFTAADYENYQDVAGDITDITIGSVYGHVSGANLVKFLAGAGRRVDNCVVTGQVRGTVPGQFGVWIGDDSATPATIGGTYGYIDVGTVHVTSTNSASASIALLSPNADKIVARIIEDDTAENAKAQSIQTFATSVATIKHLVLNDCILPNRYGLNSNVPDLTIDQLTINRPYSSGAFPLVHVPRGTINNVVVRDGKFDGCTRAINVDSASGGSIGRLLVDNCVGTYSMGYLVQVTTVATGTIGEVIVRGGRHTDMNALFRSANPGVFAGTVTLDNCVVKTATTVAVINGSATIVLKNPLLDSVSAAAFQITGGPMTIQGEARINGTFLLLSRAASETVRVNGRNLPIDVALLTPAAGDMVTNTNSASASTGSLISDGAAWKNLAVTTNVQVFTSSGTWTKPAGAVSVRVRLIGPGAGGGAGARGPSGTALAGGGGGGTGAMSEMFFAASDLPATVAVTIATGGAGGVGQTADGTAGASGGNASGSTTFGTYLQAGRGGPGIGGGLAAGGTAGNRGSGLFLGGPGGAGSTTGAAGGAAGTGPGPGGGGAGGGITTGATANAGSVGGVPDILLSLVTGGTAGSGANGGAGTASTIKGPGPGGGGGGANAAGAGYNGGNGGSYGAGGGGGGASLNGSTSGAGGNGADGVCVVTTYF